MPLKGWISLRLAVTTPTLTTKFSSIWGCCTPSITDTSGRELSPVGSYEEAVPKAL